MSKRKNLKLLNPLSMFLAGMLLGTASRLFDIYCENLGEIFSQMAIWVLLGTLISIYSPTRKSAMLNILPFCIGMIITYYATAIISHGVYGWSYILGWTVFALLSPIMAFFAWTAKREGAFAKLLAAGIVLVSLLSSVLMFDGPRVYDFVIDAALIYFLFFKKIRRSESDL